MKDDEMGGACCTHRRDSYIIWSENLKGRDHPEDLGVNMRIILQWILRK